MSIKVKRLLHERRSTLRLILLDAAMFVFLFGVTLLLQGASGAHSAALGVEPDESAHYVTGVMVHDYIGRGFPGNPLTFAKEFYVHYPRVAFGLWPPLFHVCSGVWMLAFGTGRSSVMFMLAALTTSWAWFLYRMGRPVFGIIGGTSSALLLVCLPLSQKWTSAVMLDMPLALVMLLAMGAYARYLETDRTRDALVFGLCSAVALLIKYNALALALLPPLCVVITGRHHLWRSKKFWLPAAVVLVVAGPWYLFMRHLVLYAADPGGSAPAGPEVAANAKGILFVASPVVFVLAVIGSLLLLLNCHRRLRAETTNHSSLYAVAASTVLAVFLFHSAYPLYEARYLLPAAPALFILSWPTILHIRSVSSSRPWIAISVLIVIVAVHVLSSFFVPVKNTRAYVMVAKEVLSSGLPHNGAVLVSAEAVGEGMLTAEFVMHDRRPDHYIVRASKVLATQTLMGDKYQLKYKNPEEMMTALDAIPISTVVIQACPKGKCGGHEDLLTQTAQRYPERWQLSSVIPSETGSPILIYRIAGNEHKPVRALDIDITPTLGTTVEKQ